MVPTKGGPFGSVVRSPKRHSVSSSSGMMSCGRCPVHLLQDPRRAPWQPRIKAVVSSVDNRDIGAMNAQVSHRPGETVLPDKHRQIIPVSRVTSRAISPPTVPRKAVVVGVGARRARRDRSVSTVNKLAIGRTHVLTRTAVAPPSRPLEAGRMAEAPLPDLALGREVSVPLPEERARKLLDVSCSSYLSFFDTLFYILCVIYLFCVA